MERCAAGNATWPALPWHVSSPVRPRQQPLQPIPLGNQQGVVFVDLLRSVQERRDNRSVQVLLPLTPGDDSGHDDDTPIYNPRFLAFATHYGFRPLTSV